MSYFWSTSYTIPPNVGFSHYGPGHCLWLAVWVGLCAALRLLVHTPLQNRRCRHVIAVLLLLDEFVKYAVTLPHGTFRADFLPLHLCSINLFVILTDAMLEARSPHSAALSYLREVLYAICLPGAFFALLFPGWGELPHANLLCIHSFTAHILLFLYPYLLLLDGFSPSFRRLVRVLPFFLVILPCIYCLNLLWGTNFMFLRTAGLKNPLTWFERTLGSPGYLIGFVPLCALTWLALYAAPKLLKRLHKR